MPNAQCPMPNAQCRGLCVQSPSWRSDKWFLTLCTGQLYDFFKHLKSIVGFSLLILSMCVALRILHAQDGAAGEDTRLELASTQVEYSVDLGVFRGSLRSGGAMHSQNHISIPSDTRFYFFQEFS